MLLLWSMKEKHNCNSKFKLYFDTLLAVFNTGLTFGVSAIMALDGTVLLEEIVQAKEHLCNQYEPLFPVLCENYPDVFPPELYTWEQFLWACELWYSNSMKILFSDGKLRTCLIPVAGFLNHSFYIDIAPDEDCEDGVCMCDWDTHMVRGTWFSKNNSIYNYGLPPPLLEHLRRARGPIYRTKTCDNLEIELEILDDHHSTFEGMMESLGEEELDDRESSSWAVKLAMEFKDLQKRIVSSIVTSWNAGRELLEYELGRCTE